MRAIVLDTDVVSQSFKRLWGPETRGQAMSWGLADSAGLG